MARRIDRYRMVDGTTPLSARYFNAVWQDLDLRIDAVEGLRISWEEAVRRVSDLGLTRINEVLRPALDSVDASVQRADGMLNDVETARQQAVRAIDGVLQQLEEMPGQIEQAVHAATQRISSHEAGAEQSIASWKAQRLADIERWKTDRIAELEAWRSLWTGALPQFEQRVDAVERIAAKALSQGSAQPGQLLALALDGSVEGVPRTMVLDYEARAELRQKRGALAIVSGLGLFAWTEGGLATDDDQTCFAAQDGSGTWECVAPSLDACQAAWLLAFDQVDERAEALESRAGALEARTATVEAFAARFLRASFAMSITSLASTTEVTQTIAVAGADIGDSVLITPGNSIGASTADNARLSVSAYVSAANTITASIRNASAATATLTPANWSVLVIKT